MTPEFKYVSPYLPYKANCVWTREDDKQEIESTLTISDYEFLIKKNSAKLVLRSLLDIAEEMEFNGEKITPIIELAKISGFHYKFGEIVNENDTIVLYSKPVKHPSANSPLIKHFFEIDLDNCDFDWGFVFFDKDDKKEVETVFFPIRNQVELINKLLEWNFDIFNLIPKGLAFPYNKSKEK